MGIELTKEQLERLARLGAQARLDELEAERKAIVRAFPALARGSRATTAQADAGAGANSAAPTRRRGRRKMTAAQKKAQSERMKKIWAERKKAQ
jgi:hypothetical protein